jgi:periplasmic protein CpxP/Spy
MNKNKLIRIVAIVLLLTNIALLSFILLMKPKHPRGEGPRNIIIEKLHFDRNQILKYDKLIFVHRAKIKKKEKEIIEIKNSLYLQLLEENNHLTIDSLQNRIGFVQTEIENIHYRHFEEIHQLCNNDQEKYYAELVKEIAKLFSMHRRPPPQK